VGQAEDEVGEQTQDQGHHDRMEGDVLSAEEGWERRRWVNNAPP
jgi:hypothetical protein